MYIGAVWRNELDGTKVLWAGAAAGVGVELVDGLYSNADVASLS